MKLIDNILLNLKSTETKLNLLSEIENKLSELSINKTDLLDKYNRINKAVNDVDFECKEEILAKKNSFESEYVSELSSIKLQEKRLKNQKESILKSVDVKEHIDKVNQKEAINNIKSMYHKQLISLDCYNDIIKGYTKNNKTEYADVCVFNNKGELLLVQILALMVTHIANI